MAGEMPIRNERDFRERHTILARLLDLLKRPVRALAVAEPEIMGVDLAPDYQAGEVISVRQMMEAGYRFAVVQATRGTWHHSNFLEFCKPLVDGGMFVMTYGLYYGNISGEAQAMELLEEAYKLWRYQSYITPVFGDVEVRDGATVSVRRQRYGAWKGVIRTSGAVQGTYSSYYLWKELMNDMPLDPGEIGWVASWSPYTTFTPPVGWRRDQCKFRQIGVALKHAWVAPVPGMKSDVDVDKFFGGTAALYALSKMANELPSMSPSASPSASASPSPSPSPEPPVIEEDTDMDYAKIDEFMAKYPNAQIVLNVNGGSLEGTTPIPPTPTNVRTVRVVENENANGFWQVAWNSATPRKPVLDICRDANGRPVKQWAEGTLQVYTPDADVDGTTKFYVVYGYEFPVATYPNRFNNQKCYVKLGDVEFV